jgi:hypothetical protein
MTMSVRVRMPSLVSTMSTHWQKELNVVEKNTCNYSRPKWKLTSCTMAAKMSWITSWAPMHSWAQYKKWIPIKSMGCGHTHWGIPVVERWGNLSRVWSVVENTKEDNQKATKIGQAINQTSTPKPKQDNIWAWWASDIPSESMLDRVWWCRRSKMESWSWIGCFPMSCSNGGKHTRARGGKKSHVTLRCY